MKYLCFSGTFKWTVERDRLFLREVLFSEPYLYKPGTKEAGLKWSEVAQKINTLAHFSSKPRDQRSVREHFNKLLTDYKKKIEEEEASSGTSPDPPTENETMLEEIVEKLKSAPAPSTKKDEKKREAALNCRDKAMNTWTKTKKREQDDPDSEAEGDENEQTPIKRRKKRRGSSDALKYLAEKSEREAELKKEELQLRKEELRLQAENQKEQFKMQQEQMKLMADVLSQLKK